METMKAIKFKLTKIGQKRAYYFSRKAFRWFPMALAEAELLLATKQAYQVPEDAQFG